MAVVASQGQGEGKLYDIPDDVLAQYELERQELSDDVRSEMFPGAESPGREQAEGVMAPGAMGGDVQAYGHSCICWVRRRRVIYWWYCPC
jgi:hypothetical protein